MECPGPCSACLLAALVNRTVRSAEREEGDFASMVWLTLIGSKGGSEFTRSQCVSQRLEGFAIYNLLSFFDSR